MAVASNPVGAVPVMDGANPRIISAYAKEVISGGQLVFASGAGAVSSGAASFVDTDIEVAAGASGGQFTGIALQNTASGAQAAVATRGCFIVKANGTVTAAYGVQVDGADSVANAGSFTLDGTMRVVGRALMSASSGGYTVVDFHG